MPYLDTGEGHELYYEVQGQNSNQPPILFVHGGPGAACREQDQRLFAGINRPVIYLDQRGCGKSRYQDPFKNNRTENLVQDIELLRQAIGTDKLILAGGSWGSTLSLCYAIAHPEHVERMILWGIFLCRQAELDWFYRNGASMLFPEEYEHFMAPIQGADDPVSAYYRKVTEGTFKDRANAASHWARWEAVNSFIEPNEETLQNFSDPESSLPMVMLESWYFMNRGFIDEDHILKQAHLLKHIPISLVHGRYDTICPIQSAWLLSHQLKHASLHVSPLAAHDASEAQNFTALRELLLATNAD